MGLALNGIFGDLGGLRAEIWGLAGLGVRQLGYGVGFIDVWERRYFGHCLFRPRVGQGGDFWVTDFGAGSMKNS